MHRRSESWKTQSLATQRNCSDYSCQRLPTCRQCRELKAPRQCIQNYMMVCMIRPKLIQPRSSLLLHSSPWANLHKGWEDTNQSQPTILPCKFLPTQAPPTQYTQSCILGHKNNPNSDLPDILPYWRSLLLVYPHMGSVSKSRPSPMLPPYKLNLVLPCSL
jgi:hypothetical protein